MLYVLKFKILLIRNESFAITGLRAEDHGGAGEISSPEFEKEYQPEQRLPRVTMSHWRFQSGGLGSLIHTIALQVSQICRFYVIWKPFVFLFV